MRCVYVIAQEGPTEYLKVGWAENATYRLRNMQPNCQYKLRIVHEEPAAEARLVERLAHTMLQPYRRWGEWFDVAPNVAVEIVKKAACEVADPKWVPPWKQSDIRKPQRPRAAKKQVVRVSLNPEIVEILARLAAEDGRNTQNMIEHALREWLYKRQGQSPLTPPGPQ